MPTVKVRIDWPQDAEPLPESARARVTVEDASLADAASQVLGEAVLEGLSIEQPATAEVSVDDVDPRADIIVRVHVSRGGEPSRAIAEGDLITTRSYPVLTHGYGDSVVVRPRAVGT
jgi:type III secretion system (T3SS) chaperone YscW